MENDTIYHHVKKMMRFGQLIRICPVNIEQATETRQISPNGNLAAGDYHQNVPPKFNVDSICSFKYSQLQLVLNFVIWFIVGGFVCFGQAFMYNLQNNGIQIIGFSVFALTLVIFPIAIVFYCNKNTPQLLKALDGVYKVDLKIHEITRELNLTVGFQQGGVKSGQRVMFLVCFGYVAALAIDNAFMGEASCMMDIHKVCRNTIFNTQLKAALFMGSISVISQIGVGAFIMLLQNILLEFKSRVEKIQECMVAATSFEELRTEESDLYPFERVIESGNVNQSQSIKCSDQLSKMGIKMERIRKIHQELMDSLESIMAFAHPQCLFAFTSLFLSSLGKMFFSQEAFSRCMYRHSVSMGCMSFWMIVVVFAFCYYSQQVKDQISASNKILDRAYAFQKYFHGQVALFKSHINDAESGITNVSNFFILDNSFFLGFINAIATYFVIMVQFNMGGGEKCPMDMSAMNNSSNATMV